MINSKKILINKFNSGKYTGDRLIMLLGVYFFLAYNQKIKAQSDSTNVNNSIYNKAYKFAKKELKITGGINANLTGYAMEGITARRDPFFWIINANLNIRFKEISIPFSATFSQQNRSYTRPQPFNQFGMSPKYKYLTFHLGYRNIQFSEFTLAGNIFLGGGIEVNKQDFPVKFVILGGRFAKAYSNTDLNSLRNFPSYERWGFGGKVTFEKENRSLSFILFRAADNPGSLSDSMASVLNIKPAENLVVGTTAKFPIGKKINFNGEYALSSFNPDIRLPEKKLNDYTYANNLGGLFTPRQGSQFNAAFMGNLDYTLKIIRFNVAYRRVGPEYKTLGSTFLNNDFEDITGGINWQMFKNKWNFAVNSGFQRNNLGGGQLSTMVRWIGSGNVTFTPNDRSNYNVNYANFNSSTQLTPFVFNATNDVRPDSLLYLQVTNSAGFAANYGIGKQARRKNISFNTNFQDAKDNKGVHTQFYNINTGFSTRMPEYKLDVTTSANFTENNSPRTKISNLGPALTLGKPILKDKVKLTYTFTLLNTFTNGNFTGNIINNRIAGSYTLRKRHNITGDVVYLMRETSLGTIRSFRELRMGLNYGWSF